MVSRGPELEEVGVAEQAPCSARSSDDRVLRVRLAGHGRRSRARRRRRASIAACWSNRVPNVSEGRRLDVVDRLADALTSVAGRVPARPDERREPQPLGVHAGRRARARVAGARSDGRPGDRRDRHGGAHGRAPADRGRRRHPVRAARRHDDGRRASSWPGPSASGSPPASDLPVYLYAAGRARAGPGQARRRPARPVRGPQGRDRPERPRARLRPGADAPAAGAVAVGARPFLIAWNINLDSDDVELAKRIARRVRESGGGLPKVQANGFWVEEPERGHAPGPGLDEPAGLLASTPMWRVWETSGSWPPRTGSELAESELIGLAPLAALLDVADHAGAPPDEPVEADSRRRPRPRSCGCATSPRCMALELRLAAARDAVGGRGSDAPPHRGRPRRRPTHPGS